MARRARQPVPAAGASDGAGVIRSAGIYLVARVVAAACGLIAVMIYTRLLGPQAYGLYALLITAVFALFEILFRWIGAGTVRFLPAAPSVRSPVLGAAVGGYALVAAGVVLVTLALRQAGVLPVPSPLLLLSAAVLLAHAACEIMLGVVQARRRPAWYGGLVATRAVSMVGVGTVLALFGFKAAGLLCGVLVANLAPVGFLAVRHARDLLAARCELTRLRSFATFGLPMALVGISGTCIALSDRYVIAALLGVDAAGTYAAPYDLTFRSLNMVMLGCFLALSPLVFRSFDGGDEARARRHLRRQAQLHLIAGVPLACLLALGAPVVGRIAFGEAFRAPAVALIPWFAAAAFLQGLQAFYLSYLFTVRGRTLCNAAIALGVALVNLALNFVLVPTIGVVGAALATLLSYVLVITASVLVARRWLTLPWPALDMVKVGAACLAAAPLALAARTTDRLLPALPLLGAALLLALALIVLLDTAGLRAPLIATLRPRRLPPPPNPNPAV